MPRGPQHFKLCCFPQNALMQTLQTSPDAVIRTKGARLQSFVYYSKHTQPLREHSKNTFIHHEHHHN